MYVFIGCAVHAGVVKTLHIWHSKSEQVYIILLSITDTFEIKLKTIFTIAVVIFHDNFFFCFWYLDCWRIMSLLKLSFQKQITASLKGLFLCHLKNSFADYLCVFLIKINIVLTVLQLIKWLSNPWFALCSEPSDLILTSCMTVCPWKLPTVGMFVNNYLINTTTGQCSFLPKPHHSNK